MDARRDLIDYLRRQLVGPANGETEEITAPPDRRYLMGTLYPQDSDLQRRLAETHEEPDPLRAESETEETRFADDPVPESNAWLPSSLGLSVFTDAEELILVCQAARYITVRGQGPRHWRREPLLAVSVPVKIGQTDVKVFGGRAEVRLRWRPFGNGNLVTVALVNSAFAPEPVPGKRPQPQWDDMLFQVSLEVEPVGGTFLPYPSVRLTSRDLEEQELRLQYRHVVTHAVGHGCAVEEDKANGTIAKVRTQVMPEAEVPGVQAAGASDSPVLTLAHLGDPAVSAAELRAELRDFTRGYRDWCERQCEIDVPPVGQAAAHRILERIRIAVERIEAGIDALCRDDNSTELQAFRLANRAMALQMRHMKKDLAGERRRRTDAVPKDPEPAADAAWYPFQLGFFLLAAQGLIDETHPDREVVDLIWFPAGGGKTEAYLLLASFEMLLRRLRYGRAGGGTTVISRYTLSLLTTQQFQRAATTVCALEYLRDPVGLTPEEASKAPEPLLGREPFSIGLWVGMTTSPNTYEEARRAFEDQRAAQRPEDVFILDRCPWCGTRLLPASKSPQIEDYGVQAKEDSFKFFCPRDNCRFHHVLPVSVVDQHIYDHPPTFLLGTVDKFARLAWVPEARSLFGNQGHRRPSLVIQDELHLLTGPLGTTVGLYEAAVLQLCAWGEGPGPKVIASTATIRRASEQVRQTYGRDVQLFPPAGLDARFSYFAEPDTDSPGRRYVGVMAQGHTAGRATVATAAALLQGPLELPQEHRDDYWTLVAYHHSLRELGRTKTAAADDIPAQLAGMGEPGSHRELTEREVQELTSNLARSDQPKLLDDLERPWDHERSVSFLVCTNMLSVGVDVKRLALMLMLGQPKATAEYIQATSRVGRHNIPGLVVTFLNSTRPRDRSHYETFDTYHQALYQHVEPTSVTPWSIPSRRRALHAALVVLVRHGIGLAAENQAGAILDHPTELADAAAKIADWVARCDPASADAAERDLTALRRQWREHAQHAKDNGKNYYYRNVGKGQTNLLGNFGRTDGLWATPHSMRSVDQECQVIVKGAGE
ncbi:helicase-related protein [Streptomyces sp. NBC_00510]